jgi:hypothetical protein
VPRQFLRVRFDHQRGCHVAVFSDDERALGLVECARCRRPIAVTSWDRGVDFCHPWPRPWHRHDCRSSARYQRGQAPVS